MSKSKDRVVVFGGSGFLGSHVADSLTESGYAVTIFDLKKSPYAGTGQKTVIGDIRDRSAVREAIKGSRYVYNFSGLSDIEECSNSPMDAVNTNILGHCAVLEACAAENVERVVFASSIYVYSSHGSFYKITKQTCEHLTEEYLNKFGLKYTILRYGSLYGPRSQMWNGLYRYVYQAVREGRIDYPGTGDEKRDYIHVFDAAKASVDCLKDEFLNKCVVITGATSLSSSELLTMIKEMMDNGIDINITNETRFHHYTITPYSFAPKLGVKYTPNPSIDLGEGILQLMQTILKDNGDGDELR